MAPERLKTNENDTPSQEVVVVRGWDGTLTVSLTSQPNKAYLISTGRDTPQQENPYVSIALGQYEGILLADQLSEVKIYPNDEGVEIFSETKIIDPNQIKIVKEGVRMFEEARRANSLNFLTLEALEEAFNSGGSLPKGTYDCMDPNEEGLAMAINAIPLRSEGQLLGLELIMCPEGLPSERSAYMLEVLEKVELPTGVK